MNYLSFFFVFLFTLPVFAGGLITEDGLLKCSSQGYGYTIYYDGCPDGLSCFSIPDNSECSTLDLIDGELIPNPDKKFARELKEKNDLDAEKAKQNARKLARERLESLNPDGARTIADLKAMIKDLLEAVKE